MERTPIVPDAPRIPPDRLIGLTAGLASAAAVGLVSLIICREAGDLPSGEIIFARAVVGLVVSTPIVWRRLGELGGRRAGVVRVRAAALALSMLCFAWNLQHTSLGMASMLFNASLLLILGIGWTMGELAPGLRTVGGLLLAAAGAWVYWFAADSPLSPAVVGVGLLGALAAALAYVTLKQATRVAGPWLINWAACAAMIPLSLIAPGGEWVMPTPQGLALLAAIGLGVVFAQVTLIESFARLPLPLASALVPSFIVWGVVGEAFTDGTHTTFQAIAGTAIYAVGVCALAAERGRPGRREFLAGTTAILIFFAATARADDGKDVDCGSEQYRVDFASHRICRLATADGPCDREFSFSTDTGGRFAFSFDDTEARFGPFRQSYVLDLAAMKLHRETRCLMKNGEVRRDGQAFDGCVPYVEATLDLECHFRQPAQVGK